MEHGLFEVKNTTPEFLSHHFMTHLHTILVWRVVSFKIKSINTVIDK